jgi:hypothetical protein
MAAETHTLSYFYHRTCVSEFGPNPTQAVSSCDQEASIPTARKCQFLPGKFNFFVDSYVDVISLCNEVDLPL